ncbi:hypothetical protein VFPFJ_01238 [Purpureocillium lilacinum]|nr:hypothetical protein VFPFJ_01238 [Purpureocillium lilacinum]OAQ95129.1 hypothetical protein VFPFJ_01238 [Purpureocillium lilacinum]
MTAQGGTLPARDGTSTSVASNLNGETGGFRSPMESWSPRGPLIPPMDAVGSCPRRTGPPSGAGTPSIGGLARPLELDKLEQHHGQRASGPSKALDQRTGRHTSSN